MSLESSQVNKWLSIGIQKSVVNRKMLTGRLGVISRTAVENIKQKFYFSFWTHVEV